MAPLKTPLCPICKKQRVGYNKNGFTREYCGPACQKKAHSATIAMALNIHRRARREAI